MKPMIVTIPVLVPHESGYMTFREYYLSLFNDEVTEMLMGVEEQYSVDGNFITHELEPDQAEIMLKYPEFML